MLSGLSVSRYLLILMGGSSPDAIRLARRNPACRPVPLVIQAADGQICGRSGRFRDDRNVGRSRLELDLFEHDHELRRAR